MNWHDLVIAAGGFIMIGSMVPSLLNKKTRYPAYGSAILTAVLAVYTYTFLDWGAILSAITVSGQSACWGFALLFRRLKK